MALPPHSACYCFSIYKYKAVRASHVHAAVNLDNLAGNIA